MCTYIVHNGHTYTHRKLWRAKKKSFVLVYKYTKVFKFCEKSTKEKYKIFKKLFVSNVVREQKQ